MRRLLRLAIPLLLVAGIAGHFFYWYWPRERASVPAGMPARLLASGEYGACLWVPYPHQNLGKLEGAIADGPAYLAAAARVADLPAPVMRSFGPFAVPPSSEIVACSDLDGDRFLLVARVYPAPRGGGEARRPPGGQPLAEGGRRSRRSEGSATKVEERVLQVAWRDGYWTVRSGAEPALPAAAAMGARLRRTTPRAWGSSTSGRRSRTSRPATTFSSGRGRAST